MYIDIVIRFPHNKPKDVIPTTCIIPVSYVAGSDHGVGLKSIQFVGFFFEQTRIHI